MEKSYEIGKKYMYTDGTGGYPKLGIKPLQHFVCTDVGRGGTCISNKVLFNGESRDKGWYVALQSDLNDGTVIEVEE